MNLPTETEIGDVKHWLYCQDYVTDLDKTFSIYFYAVDDLHALCVLEDIRSSAEKPKRILSITKG